jgi:bacterioferritin-associated ferredoxin
MYICICNAITEREVKACVERGACSLDELAFELGVGSGCGRCRECATQLLQEARREDTVASYVPASSLTR